MKEGNRRRLSNIKKVIAVTSQRGSAGRCPFKWHLIIISCVRLKVFFRRLLFWRIKVPKTRESSLLSLPPCWRRPGNVNMSTYDNSDSNCRCCLLRMPYGTITATLLTVCGLVISITALLHSTSISDRLFHELLHRKFFWYVLLTICSSLVCSNDLLCMFE